MDEHDDGDGDGEDDVAPTALGVVVLLQRSSRGGGKFELSRNLAEHALISQHFLNVVSKLFYIKTIFLFANDVATLISHKNIPL